MPPRIPAYSDADRIAAPRAETRAQLEKEYVFIGVVTTFLRAIRAGVIHFRHAATILAHHGRLGPTFDLCSKVIIEILREEGMYKNNGETVVAVVCQALQEVSSNICSIQCMTMNRCLAVFHAVSGVCSPHWRSCYCSWEGALRLPDDPWSSTRCCPPAGPEIRRRHSHGELGLGR